MPYTILHISDLHRSPLDPIGNEALLSSLVADLARSRSEIPQIGHPDCIVVSGDVIQGAALSDPNYIAVVEEQYEVALQLLNSLAERFVDGDHARVVVVPGNHDVNWNVALSAMETIPDDKIPKDLRPSVDFAPSSRLRWDWKSRKLYQIVDTPKYESRLAHYRNFVASFYDKTDVVYPINPDSDYCLFELNKGRIGVAAFSSCMGNDCFAYHGAISQSSLAQAYIDLHDRTPQYDLLMAVWHHSIEGPPGASDYMDIATVYNLIGYGFRLGLHGHQHRAQTSNRFIHLPKQEPMAVVSAGSLCAGPRELPTGVNRQYNVIEIADDCSSVRVHVREMTVGTIFAPARRAEFGGQSYIDMEIGRADSAGKTERARDDSKIIEAEQAIQDGEPKQALNLLRDVHSAKGTYAHALMVKAAIAAGDWETTVQLISPPSNIDDLVTLVRSYVELNSFDEADQALVAFGEDLGLHGAVRTDLQKYIAAKRHLHE
jgi:hypothetical protein